ncbi:MAG: VOC family protein [Pseudomonadales bacterium]|nr:VOC family protein [Pseudomonadales bacterium]
MKPILFAATANPDASRNFYENVLGLNFTSEAPYAIVFETEGITLRIQKVEEVVSVPYTTLGFEVTDMADAITKLNNKGIELEQFEFLEQDASGVWTTPDGAKVAWCRDPDGSMVSLTQLP